MVALKSENDDVITMGWVDQKKIKKGLRVKIENDVRWWKVVEAYTNISLNQKELDAIRSDSLSKQIEIK